MQKFYELKIFQGVDTNIIDMIIHGSPKEFYQAKNTILSQGEANNGKGYIIIHGEVNIIIDGVYRTTLSEGEIFGEIALLNEEDRTATVQAKTDVECITISQENIFDLINNGNSSINTDIMKRIEDNLKNN